MAGADVAQVAALEPQAPAEDVRVWRPANLPHVDLMTAVNCNRLWRVFHEHYCFCVIPAGRNPKTDLATVKYRGREETYTGGSVGLMEPGETHANVRNRSGADFWVVNIDPAFVAAAAVEHGLTATPHLSIAMTENPAIVGILMRLYQSLVHGATALEQEVRLLACLRTVFDMCGDGARGSAAPWVHPRVKVARDYLHEHFAERVPLAQLASISGLSQFHFARAFTRAFGLSPHAYQNQLRIAAVMRTLRAAGDGSALETGFYDQSHLNRHFKRSYGATPRQFAGADAVETTLLPRF